MAKITATLQQLLQERVCDCTGVPASGRAYLEQTRGPVTDAEIAVILGDPAEDEHEGLLAFWGFPEDEVVMAVEQALPLTGLSETHVQALRQWFCARPRRVVRLSGGMGVELTLSQDVLSGYIQRLRLDAAVPEPLGQAVDQYLDQHRILILRRFLRCCQFAWQQEQISVCQSLIARLPGAKVRPALALLVELWRQRDQAAGLWALLVEEGQRCRQVIEQDQFQEKLLQRQTMEQMLGAGNRVLAIDRAAYRQRLALLDTIALQLYGAPLPAPQEPLQWSMGSFDADDPQDVAALMRRLS
ncbi:MAG: hypothetical protein R6Y91_00125 [Desulfohalobium sp.]